MTVVNKLKSFVKNQVAGLNRAVESHRAEIPSECCASGAPFWHLDSPDITQPIGDTFEIRGWIASFQKVDRIYFTDLKLGSLLPLREETRSDVEEVYGVPAIGFSASCDFAKISQRQFLTLNFDVAKKAFDIVIPVPQRFLTRQEIKQEKLKRISSVVVCPNCKSEKLNIAESSLRCNPCGANYTFDEKSYNFLVSDELRREFHIVPTENISANQYDGTALNFIHSMPEGLILDCGAGFRDRYYSNVVNFEIVPYESTDVVGIGEKLPFKDRSFDCIFSFAVLEHVKDPFVCAKELSRVLKPGGVLYCQVPFLQPFHAYPHHYYNMTQQGLRNLFNDQLSEVSVGTLTFGQPIFLLSWFLNSYCAGLPLKEQQAFKELRVADLLKPASSYLGASFVHKLSSKVQSEIASCNYLLGKK